MLHSKEKSTNTLTALRTIKLLNYFSMLTSYLEIGSAGPGPSLVAGFHTVFVRVLAKHVVDDQDVTVSFLADLTLRAVCQLAGTLVPG